MGNNTHVSTRVIGTYGYAAPEYVMTGEGEGGGPSLSEGQATHCYTLSHAAAHCCT